MSEEVGQVELATIANDALAVHCSPLMRYQRGSRYALRDGVALHAAGLPGPSFNVAAVVGRSVPSLEHVLSLAKDFFGDQPGGYGILVEGDVGHPIEEAIRRIGGTIAEQEPVLVWPVVPPPSDPPPDYAIRRVTTPDDLSAYLRVIQDIFAVPDEMIEGMVPDAGCLEDPHVAFFLGESGGMVLGGAVACLVGATSVVWGVGTLPAYRGRGFGASITRAASAAHLERGGLRAALRSGTRSLGLYRRIGFRDATLHRTYVMASE